MRRFCFFSFSLAVSLAGFIFFARAQGTENLALTTYYPAPYGVYVELRAQRMAIGPTYYKPATVALTAGNDLLVEESIGVGVTNPSGNGYKLDATSAGNCIRGVSNTGNGVYGTSKSGFGVNGLSTSNYGVYGSTITGSAGVCGAGPWGVSGQTSTTNGYGVYGEDDSASGNGVGVFAISSSNKGVFGIGSTYGVVGSAFSTSGIGVNGVGATYGVYGHTTKFYGLYGDGGMYGVSGTGSQEGVLGYGPIGVYGEGASSGVSGVGTNGTGSGVTGTGLNGVNGTGTASGGLGGIGVSGTGTYQGVSGCGGGVGGVIIQGVGVYGSGSLYGMYAQVNNSSGYGIAAYNPAAGGASVYGNGGGYGVVGRSSGGTGVYGSSDGSNSALSNVGVEGSGRPGVYGKSDMYGVQGTSSSGGTSFGVEGIAGTYSLSYPGYPIGVAGAGYVGVNGISQGYVGVWGGDTTNYNTSAYGVVGTGSIVGVEGYSNAVSGYGVFGYGVNTGGTGVCGLGYGVDFRAVAGYPTYADASSHINFLAQGFGVKYATFTGAHDCLLPQDYSKFKQGMIVCSTGKTHIRLEGKENESVSYTLPAVRLADKPEDKTVLGVYVSTMPKVEHWYKGKEPKGMVNAVGEGRAWVTDINGKIEVGDYITTSYVVGYGQKQNDDLLHSYTLGKATESVDWDKVDATVDYQGKKYKAYLIAVTYTSG